VTTTDAICTCIENAERQVRMFSQLVQWTPLLLVVSMFHAKIRTVCPRLSKTLLVPIQLASSVHYSRSQSFFSVFLSWYVHYIILLLRSNMPLSLQYCDGLPIMGETNISIKVTLLPLHMFNVYSKLYDEICFV